MTPSQKRSFAPTNSEAAIAAFFFGSEHARAAAGPAADLFGGAVAAFAEVALGVHLADMDAGGGFEARLHQ